MPYMLLPLVLPWVQSTHAALRPPPPFLHPRSPPIAAASHQGSGVGLGPFVQKNLGHPVVATVGCHVERSQVIQGDVVDLRIVLQ